LQHLDREEQKKEEEKKEMKQNPKNEINSLYKDEECFIIKI
jgi:hypothetical protein